jgi:hypothetical protein
MSLKRRVHADESSVSRDFIARRFHDYRLCEMSCSLGVQRAST